MKLEIPGRLALLLAACAACSGTAVGPGAVDGGLAVAGDAAPRAGEDAAAPPDAALERPAPVILETPFSLKSGFEGYLCLRATLTEDIYVSELQAAVPNGVHHTLLVIEDAPRASDGVTPCSAELGSHRVLFAAGRGTPKLELPQGVAFKMLAGERLLVHMHLFNTTEAVMAGTAGVRLGRARRETVAHEADMMLVGNVELIIPPGESTHMGKCTMPSSSTLIAVAPHMHALGTHQRVVLESGTTPQTLLDVPFSFEEQPYYLMEQPLQKWDVVRVYCTYDNYTRDTVFFGPSSTDEMCYARLLFYPRSSHSPVCVH